MRAWKAAVWQCIGRFAEKLRSHPELLAVAHDNLTRWSRQNGHSQPYFDEWERILESAAAIANDPDIVVIGSQAVLGQFPAAPPELLVSMEADVYPRQPTELSELIDGSIGEGSPFQNTFGYFAHGIGPETAVLPSGWDERLVKVENPNTFGARGWCLEVHELAIARHVAGREKDIGAELRRIVQIRIERQFAKSG